MSPAPSPTDPLVGSAFHQYEITAKLGGGGMGVVYKARDTKLGRPVALKFLPAEWSHDEAAKQRFMREAQAASATNHRNICVIHDIEETGDGRLFIVMAHYEGETLKHRLERGALPVADVIEIAMEVAEGLAKAHAQGVVHRDVKPGNLMLTDDGVKILDFGLAKFADALQLTAPGSTIGTYAYMSPEQTRGEEADARSDVWALGTVIFEMLTGAPPFRRPYPEATFHAIKYDPLPALRSLRPDVPEPLEKIVTKALDKDTAARYQSAREPARDLRQLAGRTVPLELRTEMLPALDTRRTDLNVPHARRRTSWLGTAVLVLAALSAAAVYWVWYRPVERIGVVVAPVANHTGVIDLEADRLALTEALASTLATSPNIRVVPYLRLLEIIRPFVARGGDVSSSEAVQAIAANAGAPFVVVPTLVYRDRDSTWLMEVQVRNAATGTTTATYETAPVTSSLSEQTAYRLTMTAADSIQEHFREHGPGRSYGASLSGRRPFNAGGARAFEAGLNAYEVMEYQSAADAFARAVAADDQNPLAHTWLARTLLLLGRRSEAVVAVQRGRALLAASDRSADSVLVDAVLAEGLGDGDVAERRYKQLTTLVNDEPLMATELADYLKRRQDRNAQAIEAYHAVLAKDRSYLRLHVDLCQLYARLDNYPLADREGKTALDGARTARNQSVEAQALLCLAESQRKSRRDFDEARRLAGEARQLLETLGQPYNLARGVFYQASMDFSAGQYLAAAERFGEAATQLNATGNKVMEATALMNLGIANYYVGKPSRTLEIFARADQAFRDIGDERRASEMDVSLSGLQVDYGIDVDAARRRLRNARTTLEKMGHIDFQIGAMLFEAEAEAYTGGLSQARQLLRAAQAQAKDKQLSARIVALSLSLAEAAVEDGDYADALAQLASLGTDVDNPQVPLVLGLTRLQLGDVPGAIEAIGRAQAALPSASDATVPPGVEAALGQLELERGRYAQAITHFENAIASWTDPLLPSVIVEAQCARGDAEGLSGHLDRARQAFAAGQQAAERLHRHRVVAQCRLGRARLETSAGNYSAALSALEAIPDDDEQRTVGRPLRARVEYWRARALAGTRDVSAPAKMSAARDRMVALQQSLPSEYRDTFAARADVRQVLTEAPVTASRAR